MKYIIGLIVGIIVLFLIVAMYCALIVLVAPTSRQIWKTTKEMTTRCFGIKKYAHDAKPANTLMTSIQNRRFVRTSGVGDVTNVTFISHLKKSLKRAFLAV